MKRKRNYELRPEAGPIACQSSKSLPLPETDQSQEATCGPFSPYAHGLGDHDKLRIEVMTSGAKRVHWPLEGPDFSEEFDILDTPRYESEDLGRLRAGNQQSTKSRLRAAWTIGSATVNWEAMTTLTYPVSKRPKDYDETAKHRAAFLKRAMKAYPGSHYSWILEFTENQAAHYHIFWAGSIAEKMLESEKELVNRSGFDGGEVQETELVRGAIDKQIVKWWSKQADDGSPEFKKFQNGGITELIRCPEGAAKYAAKEAGKRCQKHAPFLVSQWWNMSDCRPKVSHEEEMTVGDFVDLYGPTMMKHVFKNPFD